MVCPPLILLGFYDYVLPQHDVLMLYKNDIRPTCLSVTLMVYMKDFGFVDRRLDGQQT